MSEVFHVSSEYGSQHARYSGACYTFTQYKVSPACHHARLPVLPGRHDRSGPALLYVREALDGWLAAFARVIWPAATAWLE